MRSPHHQIIHLSPIKILKLLSNTLSLSSNLIRISTTLAITLTSINTSISPIIAIMKFMHIEWWMEDSLFLWLLLACVMLGFEISALYCYVFLLASDWFFWEEWVVLEIYAVFGVVVIVSVAVFIDCTWLSNPILWWIATTSKTNLRRHQPILRSIIRCCSLIC